MIEPRTLKGFRDYPPEVMIPRERLLETVRRVYRLYGYAPIDLNGLLEELGLADKTKPVLVALDKLPKVGRDAVQREMADKAGVTPDQSDRVLKLVEIGGSNREILDRVQAEFGGNVRAAEG